MLITARLVLVLCGVFLSALLAASFLATVSLGEESTRTDWPQWRGPQGDGKSIGSDVPLEWSPKKNIVWRTRVPGRGHSSPTVVGDRVFLTTADEGVDTQSVLAFDRATGEMLWERKVFEKGHDRRAHKRNSQASSTIACAGERMFVSFLNDGAIWVLAMDFEGNEIWRKNLEQFVSHWGYSSSPAIYKSTVLIAADHKGGGVIAALAQEDGELVWSQDRPKIQNYTSPVVHHSAGRDQLILAGCNLVSSYDPNTGKLLWETEATTEECVGTTVVENGLVFASGGYPKNETVAVRTDGSGEIAWRNSVRTYVPSLLAHEGYLYTVNDKGIAYCWHAESGREMWKHRLGGVFNSSLNLIGNRIYAAGEDGTTYVFQADSTKYTQVAKNKLGENVYATPTVCGNRIYLRVAEYNSDERQEFLYCVGKGDPTEAKDVLPSQ